MNRAAEQAAAWFMRLHDDPQAGENTEFQRWLQACPEHAREYREVEALWASFRNTQETEALATVMEQRRTKRLRHSACALLLVLASSLAWLGFRQSPQELALHTHTGERSLITLRDGSELQLNAATRLDVSYQWQQRNVALHEGEALFDVARNPYRPFVIDSGAAQVTVRGTRFVVNRLPDRLRVSVDHGHVEVANTRHPEEVWQVFDGQVVEISADGHLHRLDVAAANALAFTRGNLVFENADLAEIAASLSRYRDHPVQARDEHDGPRVSAVVQLDGIEDFIRALPSIAAVQVREHDGTTELEAR